MVSLIATDQVHTGDLIYVDIDYAGQMVFERVDEDIPVEKIFRDSGLNIPDGYEAAATVAGNSTRKSYKRGM